MEEKENDSIETSSPVQSSRQLELEAKAQEHFVNDLPTLPSPSQGRVFFSVAIKYHTMNCGERSQQAGWRTSTL